MSILTTLKADSYRYTTAGKFSAPYHYIDANDSPPSSCSVDLSRDCDSEGCVVSAIKNYVCLDGTFLERWSFVTDDI